MMGNICILIISRWYPSLTITSNPIRLRFSMLILINLILFFKRKLTTLGLFLLKFCIFLGTDFFNMSARVHIPYRIIMAVCIQIQSVPVIRVFTEESCDDRIIESCTQIVLSRDRIHHLPGEAKTVLYRLFFHRTVSKRIISIMV